MSGRQNFKQIQGAINRTFGPHSYHALQNIIFDEIGINCSVVVFDNGVISIRAESYPDFILARSVLLKRHAEAQIVQG